MTYQPLASPLPVSPGNTGIASTADPSLGQIVILLTHILAALRALNTMTAANSDSTLTDLDVIASESEFLP